MQKIIKSIIVFLFIFVLLVFYNSLNRETNYSTDYLVGNKLTKINLKSFNDNKIYTDTARNSSEIYGAPSAFEPLDCFLGRRCSVLPSFLFASCP